MLLNTVFNLKLPKIDQKIRILKTWKKFGKPEKFFEKTSSNPVYSLSVKLKGLIT